ncbi:hypothetical protein [Halioxenophilus aromaticivorans]|uniref:hypothetical protein n=1 Tax=Halioxenophilus aromaticivorans TaxID=1306992 RepID=UPI0031F18371
MDVGHTKMQDSIFAHPKAARRVAHMDVRHEIPPPHYEARNYPHYRFFIRLTAACLDSLASRATETVHGFCQRLASLIQKHSRCFCHQSSGTIGTASGAQRGEAWQDFAPAKPTFTPSMAIDGLEHNPAAGPRNTMRST